MTLAALEDVISNAASSRVYRRVEIHEALELCREMGALLVENQVLIEKSQVLIEKSQKKTVPGPDVSPQTSVAKSETQT